MSKKLNSPYEQIGIKLFRHVDDELEICRVTEVTEINTIVMDVEGSTEGKGYGMSSDDIKDNGFKILAPAGYMTFSVVECQGTEDVMVTVHRRGDIENKDNMPYVVCRQFISDLITGNISEYAEVNGEFEAMTEYVGLSLTRDNAPANVNFEQLSYCDSIKSGEMIAIYLDDTIDSVLSLINENTYNDSLNKLFNIELETLANGNNIIKSSLIDKNIIGYGYCKDLRTLLDTNNFWNDLCATFNIEDLNIDLSEDGEEGVLTAYHTMILSYLLNKNITKSLVATYDYDIDLDKINKDVVLVRDKNEKLYVIGYVYNGPKYNVPQDYDGTPQSFSLMFKELEKVHQNNIEHSLNLYKRNSAKYVK